MSDYSGISQSVSGSTVYGGIQASQGSGNQQIQENQSIAFTEKQITQAEAIQLLADIKRVISASEIPQASKEESILYLEAAKKAVEKVDPKKNVAAINLKSMAETLEDVDKTVDSSKKIWDKIKPLLEQLPTWLGVAKNFFGL